MKTTPKYVRIEDDLKRKEIFYELINAGYCDTSSYMKNTGQTGIGIDYQGCVFETYGIPSYKNLVNYGNDVQSFLKSALNYE